MAVGDITSNERGSGARYNDGKIRYELIPTHLLESTAHVFAHGAKKYAEWNWAKGMDWSVVIGCMKRHIAAIERGEDYDDGPKGSGQRHVGHVICNALMLEHYMNDYPEMDDRPKWFNNKKDMNVEQRTTSTSSSGGNSNAVVECGLSDLCTNVQPSLSFLYADAYGGEYWRNSDGTVVRYDSSGAKLD